MPLYFSLTVENGIIEIIGISDKKDEINNFLHISIDWAELSNFTYTGIRKEKSVGMDSGRSSSEMAVSSYSKI